MPANTALATDHPEPRYFRPRRVFFVFAFAVVIAALVAVGWRAAVALLFGIPLVAFVVAIAAFLNAGLILSREGIEWYALTPRWRFRKVPWDAVLGVRGQHHDGRGVLYLIVESGCYERWVWGTPHEGRTAIIEIRLGTVVRGAELAEAIEEVLRRRDEVVGTRADAERS
jgi:hypothetical protein